MHRAWRWSDWLKGGTPFGAALRTVLLLVVAALALPVLLSNIQQAAVAVQAPIEGRDHGGDFIAFYAAGRLYNQQRVSAPYNLEQLRIAEIGANPSLANRGDWTANRVNPFRTLPAYLPLLGFFANFSLRTGFALSTLFEALLLGAALALMALLVAVRATPVAALTWLAISLAYWHTWQGIQYAQLPTYTIVLAFVAGMLLLRSGHQVWAGLALALLILKLQYLLPVLVFLLVLRRWRAVAALVAGCAALMLVSLVVVGPDGMLLYVQTTLQLATAPNGLYFANFQYMYNWRGLLENVLPQGPIFAAQIVLILLTYALAIWAWLAQAKAGAWRWGAAVLLLVLTMLVASPHTHGQDMVLLLPGFAFAFASLWEKRLPSLVAPASALALLILFQLLPQALAWNSGFNVLLLALILVITAVCLRMPAALRLVR